MSSGCFAGIDYANGYGLEVESGNGPGRQYIRSCICLFKKVGRKFVEGGRNLDGQNPEELSGENMCVSIQLSQ